MLTKSLHTITAATNVARTLLEASFADTIETRSRYHHPAGAWQLAHDALKALGYVIPVATAETTDVTVAKIRENCSKLLGRG